MHHQRMGSSSTRGNFRYGQELAGLILDDEVEDEGQIRYSNSKYGSSNSQNGKYYIIRAYPLKAAFTKSK